MIISYSTVTIIFYYTQGYILFVAYIVLSNMIKYIYIDTYFPYTL